MTCYASKPTQYHIPSTWIRVKTNKPLCGLYEWNLSIFDPRILTTSEFVVCPGLEMGDTRRHKVYPGSGKRRPYIQQEGMRIILS
jgi:hypothetical protein